MTLRIKKTNLGYQDYVMYNSRNFIATEEYYSFIKKFKYKDDNILSLIEALSSPSSLYIPDKLLIADSLIVFLVANFGPYFIDTSLNTSIIQEKNFMFSFLSASITILKKDLPTVTQYKNHIFHNRTLYALPSPFTLNVIE